MKIHRGGIVLLLCDELIEPWVGTSHWRASWVSWEKATSKNGKGRDSSEVMRKVFVLYYLVLTSG